VKEVGVNGRLVISGILSELDGDVMLGRSI
jgi:hypothetical protein